MINTSPMIYRSFRKSLSPLPLPCLSALHSLLSTLYPLLSSLTSRQLPIFDPVGLARRCPKAALPVCFILRIAPFEPDDGALALKCQNMGGDPVEERTIMADHNPP